VSAWRPELNTADAVTSAGGTPWKGHEGQRLTLATRKLRLGNYNQLGNDNTGHLGTAGSDMGDNLPDVKISGYITAVAAGGGHTCVLTSSEKVWCFGDNTYGQLGCVRCA
jgi:alpha-tubulin suppressor-like RCC1 family protein